MIAAESGKCKNGGCTRPIYRGRVCYRCWAGIKWTSIMQRCQNKNGNNPSYSKVKIHFTRDELISWVIKNVPPADMEIPSIDRIIPSLGYSLDNIRWIEKKINSRNLQRDIPYGMHRCPSCMIVFERNRSNFVFKNKKLNSYSSYCIGCHRKIFSKYALNRRENVKQC